MPIEEEFTHGSNGQRMRVVGNLRLRRSSSTSAAIVGADTLIPIPLSSESPAESKENRSRSEGNRGEKGDGSPAPAKRRGRPSKASIGPSPLLLAGESAGYSSKGEPENKSEGVAWRSPDPSARALFRDIGKRFNENRKKSKASAFEIYQHDLMDNLDTLVMGGVMSLKDITSTITDLEVFMRENTSDRGKSQAQLLGDWLRVDVKEIEIGKEG